jgi:hypothetical protein
MLEEAVLGYFMATSRPESPKDFHLKTACFHKLLQERGIKNQIFLKKCLTRFLSL